MPARAAMEMQPSRPPGPGGFAGFKLPGRDNPLAAAPKFESHRSRSERQSKFEDGWQSACFTGYQVRDSHFIEDIPAQTFPTEEALLQQFRPLLANIPAGSFRWISVAHECEGGFVSPAISVLLTLLGAPMSTLAEIESDSLACTRLVSGINGNDNMKLVFPFMYVLSSSSPSSSMFALN